jgi:hypothetical protein
MNEADIREYTFEGLCTDPSWETTLAYVVALVDSLANPVANPEIASYRTLYFLEEAELNISGAEELIEAQKEMLPLGYFPQTPVMHTKKWSPIAAMLERGYAPIALRRQKQGAVYCATGMWEPTISETSLPMRECRSAVELFWAIMREASDRATKRGCFVNIIAQPGWSYDQAIGALAYWSESQISKADRILWKRTPEG